MPLKHKTETRLVILLGFAIIAAGITAAVLPPLTEGGAIAWGIAFVLAALYPMLLYPKFRKDRADNVFRLMHWVPAGILALWGLLQLIGIGISGTESASTWLTWGFTLPAVAIAFFALIHFCLSVIRQRVPRLTALALLFVPYAAFALYSEGTGFQPGSLLAALQGNSSSSSSQRQVAKVDESSSSSLPYRNTSSDPSEEQWRSSLRRVDERSSSSQAVSSASSSSSKPAVVLRSVETTPRNLPESGFGFGAITIALLAGYNTYIHQRTRARG